MKKTVSVVNRTNFKNFGSVLQCYALCEAISELGYDAHILWEKGTISKHFDIRVHKIFSTFLSLLKHPSLIKRISSDVKYVCSKVISQETTDLFDRFVKEHIKQSLMDHSEMKRLARCDRYVKFVCGSDQVWTSTTLYVDPLMYLRFAPKQKRVAYAPSIGRDYIPSYNKRKMKRYISQIPCVSIREETGKRLIKDLTGRDVPVVADPTLLIDKEQWAQLEADIDTGSAYMVCYFLTEPSEKIQEQIVKTAKENSLRIVALNTELEYVSATHETEHPPCGPCEFLRYISKADLVITDSYHGMLFSIKYQKNFYSVERDYGEYDQSSRQLNIIEMLDMKDRYIRLSDDIQFKTDDVDHTRAEGILDDLITRSKAYLKHSLES